MVNDKKAYSITRYAIMFATIFVAMMLDRAISFIPIGISMAVSVLLVTLSFCFLENNWLSGCVAWLLFGVASFVKEFIFPSTTLAAFPLYVAPLVTILPRCLVGPIAFGSYRLMLRLTGNVKKTYARQTICLTVATFVGLACNTLFYLGALTIARTANNIPHDGLFAVIYAVLLTNILPEYLVSLLAVPHVVLGVRRGLKLGLNGNGAK